MPRSPSFGRPPKSAQVTDYDVTWIDAVTDVQSGTEQTHPRMLVTANRPAPSSWSSTRNSTMSTFGAYASSSGSSLGSTCCLNCFVRTDVAAERMIHRRSGRCQSSHSPIPTARDRLIPWLGTRDAAAFELCARCPDVWLKPVVENSATFRRCSPGAMAMYGDRARSDLRPTRVPEAPMTTRRAVGP